MILISPFAHWRITQAASSFRWLEVAGTKVVVQLVLPATTGTDMWEPAGVPLSRINQVTIMPVEECVDAALAGLDHREIIPIPSVEEMQLWEDYDASRRKLFAASQTGKVASRYKAADASELT